MTGVTQVTANIFEWVDNDLRLAELGEQWQQQAAIAIDTEFSRSRTFFPDVGLLQVADNKGIYLIDPLAIVDATPLKTVLQNDRVTKVIHACSEDLEVFQCYLSVLPTPLFDTQIAAGFTGYGPSIGYANLLNTMQGLTIPKEETCSDWLLRPLSQAQLNYAALDVQYLLGLYQSLCADLEKKGRLFWAQDDCHQLLAKYAKHEGYDNYYQRVKSAWKLKSHQLAVLQSLCAWREQRVRQLNIPRGRLIKDASLFDIALRLPRDIATLKRVRGITPRFAKGHAQECLQVIEQTLENPSLYPDVVVPPFTPMELEVFKTLRGKVATIGDTLKIPPQFLARKKDLEALVRSAMTAQTVEVPDSLQGWRYSVVTEPLLACLSDLVKPSV